MLVRIEESEVREGVVAFLFASIFRLLISAVSHMSTDLLINDSFHCQLHTNIL